MADSPPPVAALTVDDLAALTAGYVSDDDRVRAAQEAIAGYAAEPGGDEATAEELDDAIDWALAGAAGGATLALLAGGLYALKRRGGAEGEEAEKVLDDQSMSRREMLSLVALGGVGLGTGAVLRSSQLPARAAAAPGDGPSVLAIVIDDLNDYPGYLGGASMPVQTPNLDALAAESRTFVHHHVTVPVCPPSRATLMWGFDVTQHGLTTTSLAHPEYTAFADASTEESLPALVRAAGGIRTYGGGKVFHRNQYSRLWDRFLPTDPPAAGGEFAGDFDVGPLLDGVNPDQDLVDWMRAELRGHPGGRFLMMPGLRLPHLPWRVPQEYLDRYPLDEVVVPETPEDDWDDLGPVAVAQLEKLNPLLGKGWFELVRDRGKRREYLRGYLAAMTHTDALVGQLLDELAASPFAAETVVMVVSDNGYHQGENFAYRKLTLRDQATRTPLLVRPVPGATFTPGPVEQVVDSTTFAPTILDLLDVPASTPLPGVSLRDDRLPPPIVLTHVENSVSLVYGDGGSGGRWTLHFDPARTFGPGDVTLDDVSEMELYDRAADPDEFVNLLPPA